MSSPPPPPPAAETPNPYPPLAQQGGGHGARLPYMPGVDGLRALAVATVFIFHAGGE